MDVYVQMSARLERVMSRKCYVEKGTIVQMGAKHVEKVTSLKGLTKVSPLGIPPSGAI
jgi:hypothetical protein